MSITELFLLFLIHTQQAKKACKNPDCIIEIAPTSRFFELKADLKQVIFNVEPLNSNEKHVLKEVNTLFRYYKCNQIIAGLLVNPLKLFTLNTSYLKSNEAFYLIWESNRRYCFCYPNFLLLKKNY